MPIYVGNNKIKPNGIKEAYVGNNKVYSGAIPPHWETLWEGNKTVSTPSSTWMSTTWSFEDTELLNNVRPDCVKLRITGVLSQKNRGGYLKFNGTETSSASWSGSGAANFDIQTSGIYSTKSDKTFDTTVTSMSGSNYVQNEILQFTRSYESLGQYSGQRIALFISPSENKLKFYSIYYGNRSQASDNCSFSLTITKVEQWQE